MKTGLNNQSVYSLHLSEWPSLLRVYHFGERTRRCLCFPEATLSLWFNQGEEEYSLAYNSVISPGTSEQWEQHLQRPKGCLSFMFMEPTEASRAGSSKQGGTERKKHGQQDGSAGKPLDMITWWPETEPLSHVKEKEKNNLECVLWAPLKCCSTYIHTMWHAWMREHKHTQTHALIL